LTNFIPLFIYSIYNLDFDFIFNNSIRLRKIIIESICEIWGYTRPRLYNKLYYQLYIHLIIFQNYPASDDPYYIANLLFNDFIIENIL
jgi:hypothetical protein